jgi:formylglycine-generating enzyme required for sulfatase activity
LLQRPYDLESGRRPRIDYDRALEILKDVSLRFFLWQEGDFAADHVNVIGRHNPTAEVLGKTEDFLDQLWLETGLIQRIKEGYTFVHRSLWEYFTALALLDKKRDFVIRQAANPDWEEVVRLYAGLLPRDDDVKSLIKGLWTINRPLALRATTEVRIPAAEIIQPLIEQEEGNQGKLLLIDSLEQSLPLVAKSERQNLVQETLRIMLLECAEQDCEVIFHAQVLLEKMGLKPLQPRGVIYELLDLANAATRQKELMADPLNCFEWIKVQGDIFWMGDDHNNENEKPAHRVKLDSFYMAKHPVTNRLLSNFPLGVKYPNYGGNSHPAVSNNWWEAYYFALWVDARLPTEAEWEYAARGGKLDRRTQYYFGDNPKDLADHAWFGDPDKPFAHAVDKINPRTGKENLNPLGLANVLGNAYEWCSDWYHANYYQSSPEENPQGPETGSDRVIRGGSWRFDAQNCRSALRYRITPEFRHNFVSFRLARSVTLGS